jgi:N4-gp56 family major capsid protein
MAVQTFDSSNALTVQQWSEGLEAEVLKRISFSGFMGSGSDALCQTKSGTAKKPGDTETIGLRMQLTNAPKSSADAVEDQEQTLTFYTDTVTIDEVADAVRFKNIMDRQRVNFDMRDEAKAALADQLANAWDYSFFNQLGGNTAETEATLTGHNTVNAPSANRQYTANTAAIGDDESNLTGGDELTLDEIDRLIRLAKTTSPVIRPARIPGFNQPLYVLFIHPDQAYDLQLSIATAVGPDWPQMMQYAMQGGKVDSNPLITGALGIYKGVLLIESYRVPATAATAGGNTGRRAIFCGAQSAVSAQARFGGTATNYRWVEKYFDYDREYGIMAGFVGGIKKLQFNSEDFGTIVLSTYTSFA